MGSKARAWIGLVAGSLILLSSAAHGLVGWAAMRQALQAAGVVEGELSADLATGWYLGSVAMLVFGVIVVGSSLAVLRGREPETRAVTAVGLGYLGYGLAAYVANAFQPHFFLFIVPGALILLFALARRRTA